MLAPNAPRRILARAGRGDGAGTRRRGDQPELRDRRRQWGLRPRSGRISPGGWADQPNSASGRRGAGGRHRCSVRSSRTRPIHSSTIHATVRSPAAPAASPRQAQDRPPVDWRCPPRRTLPGRGRRRAGRGRDHRGYVLLTSLRAIPTWRGALHASFNLSGFRPPGAAPATGRPLRNWACRLANRGTSRRHHRADSCPPKSGSPTSRTPKAAPARRCGDGG